MVRRRSSLDGPALALVLVTASLAVLAGSHSPAEASPSEGSSCRLHLLGAQTGGTLDDPCPGIRPGAWIESSQGRCTINFIFSDKRRIYAGTAGHCVKPGEVVNSLSLERPIGRVAFRVKRSYFHDFALIAVYPELQAEVDSEACSWKGPTDIASGPQPDLSEVRHMGYGYGLGYVPTTERGQPLTYARRGIAPHLKDPGEMHFVGTVAPGDSGSGAYLADGRALGVITVLEASVSTWDGVQGSVGGGRLDALMKLVSHRMGNPLYLVTSDGRLVSPRSDPNSSSRQGGW